MDVNETDARDRLPELLDLVSDGEEVPFTRHGRPVAVLVQPTTLRTRRAAAVAAMAQTEDLHRRLEDARGKPLSSRGVMSRQRGDELITQIRRDGDAD